MSNNPRMDEQQKPYNFSNSLLNLAESDFKISVPDEEAELLDFLNSHSETELAQAVVNLIRAATEELRAARAGSKSTRIDMTSSEMLVCAVGNISDFERFAEPRVIKMVADKAANAEEFAAQADKLKWLPNLNGRLWSLHAVIQLHRFAQEHQLPPSKIAILQTKAEEAFEKLRSDLVTAVVTVMERFIPDVVFPDDKHYGVRVGNIIPTLDSLKTALHSLVESRKLPDEQLITQFSDVLQKVQAIYYHKLGLE